jgi:hypothetical protein
LQAKASQIFKSISEAQPKLGQPQRAKLNFFKVKPEDGQVAEDHLT